MVALFLTLYRFLIPEGVQAHSGFVGGLDVCVLVRWERLVALTASIVVAVAAVAAVAGHVLHCY